MNGPLNSASVSLLWLLDGIAQVPPTDVRVADLTLDSRQARAGGLFFALPGRSHHGLEFAAQACAQGAAVVLWEPAPGVAPPDLPNVFAAPVPGLSRLIGRIADRFFSWPSSQLRIVGITGTNGKTTCAYLLAQALSRLNSDAAYIGTVGWGRIGALERPTHTTPDAVTVHRQLSRLRALGVRDVAMEVSSHALDQGRVDGVRFHSAAFTNLTRDHLDYHGSMEAYGAAKARLIEAEGLQHLILNVGDAFCRELAHRYGGRLPVTAVWSGDGGLGWLAERCVHADDIALDLSGISMTIRGSFGEQRLTTRLLGRFNAENCAVVTACLLALRVPLGDAAAALGECLPPPGRMEVVGSEGRGSRWPWSTTRTLPTRSQRRCAPCASTAAAPCGACSAAAATGIRENGR